MEGDVEGDVEREEERDLGVFESRHLSYVLR
jgi:hypothetical protein